MPAKNPIIEINPDRIDYMLDLFKMERAELLQRASEGLKKPLTEEDVFSTDGRMFPPPDEREAGEKGVFLSKIKLSALKRVDKVLNAYGLSFYTDPALLPRAKTGSILFRKNRFNANLTFGDRALIHKMETEKGHLSVMCKLARIEIKRKMPKYRETHRPMDVARELRATLHPGYEKTLDDKGFLERLVEKLADANILVKEYIEPWNAKSKTALNGMFIAPNFIVIKRNQRAMKREIFTLAHELGHYALNVEEVDTTLGEDDGRLAQTEKWCNAFAFHFLTGGEDVKDISDDREVQAFSKKHHISRMALVTHKRITGGISGAAYGAFRRRLAEEDEANERLRKEESDRARELARARGEAPAGGIAKPINSKLERYIYANAYLAGSIEEGEIVRRYKPTQAQIENGYIDKFVYDR